MLSCRADKALVVIRRQWLGASFKRVMTAKALSERQNHLIDNRCTPQAQQPTPRGKFPQAPSHPLE